MSEGTEVLRGIVLGMQSVDEAVIRLATEAEARSLAARREIHIAGALRQASAREVADMRGRPVFMRDDEGEFVEVGRVEHATLESSSIDITSFGASFREFAPGPRVLSVVFRGVL